VLAAEQGVAASQPGDNLAPWHTSHRLRPERGRPARAEFRVFVRPQMSSDTAILPDSIGLKAAQPDKIKTIAYLLAQTVALHFYETCAPACLPPQSCRYYMCSWIRVAMCGLCTSHAAGSWTLPSLQCMTAVRNLEAWVRGSPAAGSAAAAR